MSGRRELGEFGERLAVGRLEASGLRVVARNVRTPHGEIDIVAHDGDDLVFVEVRTRRAPPGTAAESLEPAKLRRMWQCAMDYCETAGLDPGRARVDAVAIDLANNGRVASLEHFRGCEIPDDPG